MSHDSGASRWMDERMNGWMDGEGKKMEFIWLVVSIIFVFHPYLGKIPILTINIFQLAWNHQLVEFIVYGLQDSKLLCFFSCLLEVSYVRKAHGGWRCGWDDTSSWVSINSIIFLIGDVGMYIYIYIGWWFSNILYVHPETWGRFPFWLIIYFWKGLKSPTSIIWISCIYNRDQSSSSWSWKVLLTQSGIHEIGYT